MMDFHRKSILELIEDSIPERVKNPIGPDDWIRASAIGDMCFREEVLWSRSGQVRQRTPTISLAATFAQGDGMHWALQNELLPQAGVIRGQWVCQGCGEVYGKEKPGVPLHEVAIPRPNQCPLCGFDAEKPHERFWFREYELVCHERKITAHPDGMLVLPGRAGVGVFEAKSMASGLIREVEFFPRPMDIVQVHLYMKMLGLKWAVVLYWAKEPPDTKCIMKEHFVEYSPEVLEEFDSQLLQFRATLRNPRLKNMKRICYRDDCRIAKACPKVGECFAED